MIPPLSEKDLIVLDLHAAALSKDAAARPAGDAFIAESLRKVLYAVRQYERVPPAEERAAWDAYVAAVASKTSVSHPDDSARAADKLLAERRERFGGSK